MGRQTEKKKTTTERGALCKVKFYSIGSGEENESDIYGRVETGDGDSNAGAVTGL